MDSIYKQLDAVDDSLSLLNESKMDQQNLINFAGVDIADEFFKIKDKLKSPQNDLYYWINNKTVEDLAEFIKKFNSNKSNTSLKKEASDSAKLVATTTHYSIYEILSLEASQKYGRDTTWCISGIHDGREFWQTLGAAHIYFLINKHAPARSWESKFAIVVYKDNDCEIRDVNDNAMFFEEIPYSDEIHIPGIDVSRLHVIFVTCAICGEDIQPIEDYDVDDYGAHYCSTCTDIHSTIYD